MGDSRAAQVAFGAAVAMVAVVLGMAILIQGAFMNLFGGSSSPEQFWSEDVAAICSLDGGSRAREVRSSGVFDAEQRANARVIIRVGRELRVPWPGRVIAVATAIQESSLRNVQNGDSAGPDSRGLFQQRAPWGSLEARTTPAQAARMFYLGGEGGQPGLQDIPYMEEGMSVAEAAQAVQRSAHPNAYARHEDAATALVLAESFASGKPSEAPEGPEAPEVPTGLEASGVELCGKSPASGAVQQAIAYARSQLKQPYVWGGDGPDAGEKGFDCSGLTRAAYLAAGISLPRTAQAQYDHGPRVPLSQLLPGDLVFFGSGPADVTHVGLYIGGQQMIDAPHEGAVVRIEDHRWSNLLGATRPTG